MLKWLLDNKEWLFSGAGVTILIGLLLLARRVYERNRQRRVVPSAPPASQNPPAIDDSGDDETYPTPAEIAEDIKAVPPLQREAKSRAYTGLRIRWKMELFSAVEENGHIHLTLRKRSRFSPMISCTVHATEYPELRIAHIGTPVEVAGDVESADEFYIQLENVRLKVGRVRRA